MKDHTALFNTINPAHSTKLETLSCNNVSLDSIDVTLEQRGSRYGKFISHAEISQRLKDDMRMCPKWDKLPPNMKESLEMIAHKVGRILNGSPFYKDSWHDIVGYAKLVDDELTD